MFASPICAAVVGEGIRGRFTGFLASSVLGDTLDIQP